MEPFALTRHRCPENPKFEEFTSWLERNGLLVQGLGPGIAMQLMAIKPLQGILCRSMVGPRALVAETDEALDALTLSVISSSSREERDPQKVLNQAIQHWCTHHPSLPVLLGPKLVQCSSLQARLPHGLCLAFGTKKKGCLYHVASPGWDPKAPLRIRSIGKSLVCMAVLKLQAQGLLSLDDCVSKHLQSWQRPDKAHIRLQQVLNNVSGLENVPDSHPAITATDISLAEAAAMLAELPVVAPAGEKFVYLSAGYQITGAVVEQVTGKPFNQAFQELVAEPLGMCSTRFHNPSSPDPNPTNPALGNSCVSTTEDVLRFLAMLVHGGCAAGAEALMSPPGCLSEATGNTCGRPPLTAGSSRFISEDDFELFLRDQTAGADPSGCAISAKILRPELGVEPYMEGLRNADIISPELCEAAKAQTADIGYSLGGWPSRHKVTGARNFTTLGYFNSALHIAAVDSEDLVWFMTLGYTRHTAICLAGRPHGSA